MPKISKENIKENIILEYQVPVKFTERTLDNTTDFIIQGIAINETTTLNNHKFIAEELIKATPTLIGKKLLVDHDARVENIKGKVIDAQWNATEKRIDFEAKVTDNIIKQMIKEGVLDSVSIGAHAKKFTKDEDGSFVAKGIQFGELSFTPCPADQGATFIQAITEAVNKLEKENLEKENSYSRNLIGGQMEENNLKEQEKVITELQEKVKAFQEKEHLTLVESYKTLCKEKNVKELDVSKFSDEAIGVLMEQLKSVKVLETKKEEVIQEKSDGFVLERINRGFALYKK